MKAKLMRIQTKLKAPKNLYNSFGKYKYRNAEGICEAVKPFLEKEKVTLVLSDEIVEVGGKIYVKATAVLLDTEKDQSFSATAFAREPDFKKGMDDSQITGTASSYARKYALNGLFLLDDTKDPDTDEYKVQDEAMAKEEPLVDEAKVAVLVNKAVEKGVDVNKILKKYSIEKIEDMTVRMFMDAMKKMEKY